MTGRWPAGPGIGVLDERQLLLDADRAALLPAVATAGAQVRSTAEQLAGLRLAEPRCMVVVGSTAVQDVALLQAIAGQLRAPLLAADELPHWVGALDLVVVLADRTDDTTAATAAAQARHRGATVLVRCAGRGPVADAAGPDLIVPRVAVPEVLAGPGRVTVLILVAAAADLCPAVRMGALADELDAESVACGPAVESFVNPAAAVAMRLWGGTPLLVGSDQIGVALAQRGASVLAALGGLPAAAVSAGQLLSAGQLMSGIGGPADVFADPDVDDQEAAPRIAPVLLSPGPDAEPGAVALFRALGQALGGAMVVSVDETVAGAPGDRVARMTRRAGVALRLSSRLEFAAAYLGIAAGQVAPADGPAGLGPTGLAPTAGLPLLAGPATVVDGPTDEGLR